MSSIRIGKERDVWINFRKRSNKLPAYGIHVDIHPYGTMLDIASKHIGQIVAGIGYSGKAQKRRTREAVWVWPKAASASLFGNPV